MAVLPDEGEFITHLLHIFLKQWVHLIALVSGVYCQIMSTPDQGKWLEDGWMDSCNQRILRVLKNSFHTVEKMSVIYTTNLL